MSIESALVFAKKEHERGISSSYFFLVCTDMYNVFSKKSLKMIRQIVELGHEIGLHFDERRYTFECEEDFIIAVDREKRAMEELLGVKIKSVSMHRPSERTMRADYVFEDLVNTYSKSFFNKMLYLSDSRMAWKKNPFDGINQNVEGIQLLTHPIWYSTEESTISDILRGFIEISKKDRYESLKEEITDFFSIVKKEDVL